jgi:hypothetical protein
VLPPPRLYRPVGHSTPLGDEDPLGHTLPGGVTQGPEHSEDTCPVWAPNRPAGHLRRGGAGRNRAGMSSPCAFVECLTHCAHHPQYGHSPCYRPMRTIGDIREACRTTLHWLVRAHRAVLACPCPTRSRFSIQPNTNLARWAPAGAQAPHQYYQHSASHGITHTIARNTAYGVHCPCACRGG